LTDIRIEKLAELLVNYSVAVSTGDKVAVLAPVVASPLTNAVYRKVLQAGGHPMIQIHSQDTLETLYRYGTTEQLEYVHEGQRLIVEKYDVRIVIIGDENTKALSRIDPSKIVIYDKARTELTNIMMRRSATGELRWVLAPYPTNALAQDADMSLNDYEDFLYQACMPDLDDPIGYWQKVSAEQEKIVQWLKGKSSVHITGSETDLRLSVAGRTFVNCAGKFNVPDGEVFTGPVEDSAEGCVFFSYPAITSGREVSGIRLWFEKGRVVRATAEKNEDYLLQMLDTDAGARYLGEFAIGTNEGISQFTREILFDEKIGGSFHLALGAGYPETGSRNESAIHWDMVCDLRCGGEITVDDQLLYQNGRFVV